MKNKKAKGIAISLGLTLAVTNIIGQVEAAKSYPVNTLDVVSLAENQSWADDTVNGKHVWVEKSAVFTRDETGKKAITWKYTFTRYRNNWRYNNFLKLGIAKNATIVGDIVITETENGRDYNKLWQGTWQQLKSSTMLFGNKVKAVEVGDDDFSTELNEFNGNRNGELNKEGVWDVTKPHIDKIFWMFKGQHLRTTEVSFTTEFEDNIDPRTLTGVAGFFQHDGRNMDDRTYGYPMVYIRGFVDNDRDSFPNFVEKDAGSSIENANSTPPRASLKDGVNNQIYKRDEDITKDPGSYVRDDKTKLDFGAQGAYPSEGITYRWAEDSDLTTSDRNNGFTTGEPSTNVARELLENNEEIEFKKYVIVQFKPNFSQKVPLIYKVRRSDDDEYEAPNFPTTPIKVYRGETVEKVISATDNNALKSVTVTSPVSGISLKDGNDQGANTTYKELNQTTQADFSLNINLPASAGENEETINLSVNVEDKAGNNKQAEIPVVIGRYSIDKNPLGIQDKKVRATEELLAEQFISNTREMPDRTTYEWQNGTKPTKQNPQATVLVNYPDGSSETVSVRASFITNAEEFDVITTSGEAIPLSRDTLPAASNFVTNKQQLPPNTTFEWKPDNTPVIRKNSLEVQNVEIIVRYPDNSSEVVRVDVTFRDDIAPTVNKTVERLVVFNNTDIKTTTPVSVGTASDNIAVNNFSIVGEDGNAVPNFNVSINERGEISGNVGNLPLGRHTRFLKATDKAQNANNHRNVNVVFLVIDSRAREITNRDIENPVTVDEIKSLITFNAGKESTSGIIRSVIPVADDENTPLTDETVPKRGDNRVKVKLTTESGIEKIVEVRVSYQNIKEVVIPEVKVRVANGTNLTNEQKQAIREKIKEANPTLDLQDAEIIVENNGNTRINKVGVRPTNIEASRLIEVDNTAPVVYLDELEKVNVSGQQKPGIIVTNGETFRRNFKASDDSGKIKSFKLVFSGDETSIINANNIVLAQHPTASPKIFDEANSSFTVEHLNEEGAATVDNKLVGVLAGKISPNTKPLSFTTEYALSAYAVAEDEVGNLSVASTREARQVTSPTFFRFIVEHNKETFEPINLKPSDEEDNRLLVDDINTLSEAEREQVKTLLTEKNKDLINTRLPGQAVRITVADNGAATVTYPDGSTDTISGTLLFKQKPSPIKPAEKVKVLNPTNLTAEDIAKVKEAIKTANSTLNLEDSNINVSENGNVTIAKDGIKTTAFPVSEIVEKDTLLADALDKLAKAEEALANANRKKNEIGNVVNQREHDELEGLNGTLATLKKAAEDAINAMGDREEKPTLLNRLNNINAPVVPAVNDKNDNGKADSEEVSEAQGKVAKAERLKGELEAAIRNAGPISEADHASLVEKEKAYEGAKTEAQKAVGALPDVAGKSDLETRVNGLGVVAVPAVNDKNGNEILDTTDLKTAKDKLQAFETAKQALKDAITNAGAGISEADKQAIDQANTAYETAKQEAENAVNAARGVDGFNELVTTGLNEVITVPTAVNDVNNNETVDSEEVAAVRTKIAEAEKAAKAARDKKAEIGTAMSPAEKIELDGLIDAANALKTEASRLITDLGNLPEVPELNQAVSAVNVPEKTDSNDANNNGTDDAEEVAAAQGLIDAAENAKTAYENALAKAKEDGKINPTEANDLSAKKTAYEEAKRAAEAAVTAAKAGGGANGSDALSTATLTTVEAVPAVNDKNNNGEEDGAEVERVQGLIDAAKTKKEAYETALAEASKEGATPITPDKQKELEGLKKAYETARATAIAETNKAKENGGAIGSETLNTTELTEARELPEVTDKNANGIKDTEEVASATEKIAEAEKAAKAAQDRKKEIGDAMSPAEKAGLDALIDRATALKEEAKSLVNNLGEIPDRTALTERVNKIEIPTKTEANDVNDNNTVDTEEALDKNKYNPTVLDGNVAATVGKNPEERDIISKVQLDRNAGTITEVLMPDNKTPGVRPALVKVQYTDNSFDIVEVPIEFIEAIQPEVPEIKTPANDNEKVPVKDKENLTPDEINKVKEKLKELNPGLEDSEIHVDPNGAVTITKEGADEPINLQPEEVIVAKVPDTNNGEGTDTGNGDGTGTGTGNGNTDGDIQPNPGTGDGNGTGTNPGTGDGNTAGGDNNTDNNGGTTPKPGEGTGTGGTTPNPGTNTGDGTSNGGTNAGTETDKKLADKTDINALEPKVPVTNPNSLTDEERKLVENRILAANLNKNIKLVAVDKAGNATIIYEDNSTDELNQADTVVKKEQPAPNEGTGTGNEGGDNSGTDSGSDNGTGGNTGDTGSDNGTSTISGIKIPKDKITVNNPDNLTEEEKERVKDSIVTLNPDLGPDATIEVDNNGTVTIIKPNEDPVVIPAENIIKGPDSPDTDGGDTTPTPGNGDTGTDTGDNNSGNDGSNLPKPGGNDDNTPAEKIADRIDVVIPTDKIEVGKVNGLTSEEKEAVVEAILKANDGKKEITKDNIFVDKDGNTTIIYGDGSVDKISGDKLVKPKKEDSTGTGEGTGNSGTNTGDGTGNGGTNAGGDTGTGDGTGNGGTNTGDGTGNGGTNAGGDTGTGDGTGNGGTNTGDSTANPGTENKEIKVPDTKIEVKDPNNLSQSEKDAIINAIKDANKNLDNKATIEVGKDGTVTITKPDKSKITISADKVVKKPTTNLEIKIDKTLAEIIMAKPETKASKEKDKLPNTSTAKATTGGIATILFSSILAFFKRKKEDEENSQLKN